MIHIVVTVAVREERLADFLRLFVSHRNASLSEPGCIRFDALRQGPTTFAIYETWFNRVALEAHRQTPHYWRWRAEMPSLQKGMRTHEEYATLTTVFANGVWDGRELHAGHLKLLKEASELGDFLTVAVNSDASTRRLKGPTRPICPQEIRVARLQEVEGVGEVILFDTERELVELVRERRPDVLVKGKEYLNTVIPGAEYAYRLHLVEMLPGISTTLLHETVCKP